MGTAHLSERVRANDSFLMAVTRHKATAQRLLAFAPAAACLGLASTHCRRLRSVTKQEKRWSSRSGQPVSLYRISVVRGKYGFSISGTGEWTAGSGAGESVVTGQATKDELAHLTQLAADVLTAGAANCEARPLLPPGVNETVTVKKGDHETILRGAGGCLQSNCGAATSAAGKLFAFADQIINKYYP